MGLERTGAVAVHRAGREEPVAELATVLDIGGRRLALCGDARAPVVVAGAWERQWDDVRRRWLVLETDFDRRRRRIAEHDDAGRRVEAEEIDAEATRTWRVGHVDLVASHGDVLALT